jgi:hypothetical protein
VTWRRCLLLVGLLQLAATARADGAMFVRDRVLFRNGAAQPGYCSADASPDECDRVKTKVLSGYGYFRGHIVAGAQSDTELQHATGTLDVRVDVSSGSLPGGDMAVASFEAVLDLHALHRLRASLLEAKGVFVCHDAQSGKLAAPLLGMFTRECTPDGVVALDLGVGTAQWDVRTDRWSVEWLRAGPAFELLGNGLSYAHLSRSIMIALPFDLRSVLHGEAPSVDPVSFGVGLRVGAFYRTPHWETRVDLRYRTALAGGAGVAHDNVVQGELRLLHNFFLVDALVLQAGLALRGVWAQRPEESFVAWAVTDQRWLGFAGLYLGWISEPPNL